MSIDGSSPYEGRPRRVVLVTFGTRGDIAPFCVLGRALQRRGHAVRFVTTGDYQPSVSRYGLDVVETGAGFEEILRDPQFEALFRNYFAAGFATIRMLRALKARLTDRLLALMLVTLDEIRQADLVVFNAFAYFAGEFARETGRPAVRVMCQPLLPSRRDPLCLFGGRSLGRLGNRLSYEPIRFLSAMYGRAFREVWRREGAGRRLGRFGNPLTLSLRDVHHLAAFSPSLSPDPGDWPVRATTTGAWHAPPEPGASLQPYIESFLAAGPPPVYVGFGSMFWGAKRNTEVVMRALALWGGRAVVSAGPGGLQPPPFAEMRETLRPIRHADHALLFPRVAAVVHHGGAGTTASALRAGKPNVVLPLLGDQLYWGRRVAAIGAAEAPIPLRQVTPEDLAARIARACTDQAMAASAVRMARTMAEEPGVEAAADVVEGILAREKVS